MDYRRPLTVLAAVAAALMILACTGPGAPAAGESCDTPGQYHTHTDKNGTVSLVCSPDGVWRKA
jgi:hypothetical protein